MEAHRLELKISGSSMAPLINEGDMILFKEDIRAIDLGDIVLFKDTQSLEFTIHRIISTSPLITKGDNSFYPDNNGQSIIYQATKIIKKNSEIDLIQGRLCKLIAILSSYSVKTNPLRHFFFIGLKIFSILFLIQNKSYLKERTN